MTVIYITLRDTEDGLVEAETIVHGYDKDSNAMGMANRVNAFMGQIAKEQGAQPEPQSMATKIVGANGLQLAGG